VPKFLNPHLQPPISDDVHDVLVVLPSEWEAMHQNDGGTKSLALRAELSDEFERANPEYRATFAFKGSREERESVIRLKCFVGSRGNAQRLVGTFPFNLDELPHRFPRENIDSVTKSYCQRFINPAD